MVNQPWAASKQSKQQSNTGNMNYNPIPKSEFIKNSAAAKAHSVMAASETLQTGVSVALLEMSRRLCNANPADNMGACAAGHLRMLGAQDFLEIFLNLAEVQQPAKKTDSTNLPSNVRSLTQPNN